MTGGKIRIKRIYDPPAKTDGLRVLVDRIWPRGVSRDAARLDEWLKDIAPTAALRKWFGHDPKRWEEFQKRYRHELDRNAEAVDALCALTARGNVTLLYGARDEEHNQAVVLARYAHEHCGS